MFHERGDRGQDYIQCNSVCGNVCFWVGLPDKAKIDIFVETQTGNATIWICDECLGDNESITIGRVDIGGEDPCALCGRMTKISDLNAIRNPAYIEREKD